MADKPGDVGRLKERWRLSGQGRIATTAVAAIRSGRPLDRVAGLAKVGGRWDLRGLSFRSPAIRKSLADKLMQVPVFKGVAVRDTDLSYAEAEESRWQACSFSNVVLDEARMSRALMRSCKLSNVSLRGTDLGGAVFSARNFDDATEFTRCIFDCADLTDTGHYITAYSDCSFRSVQVPDVDFGGSRFSGCVFSGLLDNCLFHGHSSLMARMHGVAPESTPLNEMRNVDFSAAVLRGVSFEGVDLSSCTFPDDGRHLVVRRQHDVFLEARAIVSKDWTGEQQEAALTYLEWNHLTPNIVPNSGITEAKLRQPIDVINLDDLIEYIDSTTGPRLFDLIRSIAE